MLTGELVRGRGVSHRPHCVLGPLDHCSPCGQATGIAEACFIWEIPHHTSVCERRQHREVWWCGVCGSTCGAGEELL